MWVIYDQYLNGVTLTFHSSHSICSGPGENSTMYQSLIQSIFPISVCYNNKNIIDQKRQYFSKDKSLIPQRWKNIKISNLQQVGNWFSRGTVPYLGLNGKLLLTYYTSVRPAPVAGVGGTLLNLQNSILCPHEHFINNPIKQALAHTEKKTQVTSSTLITSHLRSRVWFSKHSCGSHKYPHILRPFQSSNHNLFPMLPCHWFPNCVVFKDPWPFG